MQELGKVRNIYIKIKGSIFRLKGSSMEPLLKEGCAIKVEPVEPCGLEIGDLVVFSKDSEDVLCCHRIVGKLKQNGKINYLEKGDNNDYIGIISEDDVIGQVRYVIDNDVIKSIEQHFLVNKIFLNLVGSIVVYHYRFAGKIKIILFSGKKNKLSIFLGRTIWRFYCLLLNMSLKIKD